MGKVVEACNKFDGDLKGTFYPLDGMTKEVQNKLIEDHFLFKYIFKIFLILFIGKEIDFWRLAT